MHLTLMALVEGFDGLSAYDAAISQHCVVVVLTEHVLIKLFSPEHYLIVSPVCYSESKIKENL